MQKRTHSLDTPVHLPREFISLEKIYKFNENGEINVDEQHRQDTIKDDQPYKFSSRSSELDGSGDN